MYHQKTMQKYLFQRISCDQNLEKFTSNMYLMKPQKTCESHIRTLVTTLNNLYYPRTKAKTNSWYYKLSNDICLTQFQVLKGL